MISCCRRGRGGRRKGTPNKATLGRALITERDLAKAKASGRKLSKEMLDHYMHIFAEIADSERAAALAEKSGNAREHEVRFERFAQYAIDCTHKLAVDLRPSAERRADDHSNTSRPLRNSLANCARNPNDEIASLLPSRPNAAGW
jgi:hypothetical protein